MFRVSQHPSSGIIKTVTAASGTGHNTGTATFLQPPSTSVFLCQYHSTNAPYQFIHLPLTVYNVSIPVLQFSPVSIIPPTLHTHPFTYHPHYIMFLSQYFSFPLSVPFHQCSIHIHSPTTHTMFLSQYFSFPLSVPFHQCSIHIHSPTTHTMFLFQYFSFPLSVPFHQCSIPIHSPTTHTI